MIKLTRKDKRTNLEKEIDCLIQSMAKEAPDTDEYRKMAENLEILYKAKALEKDRSVSSDTLAVVAGNLAGILLILKYEELNVITSKALGFVLKGRV